MRLVLTALAWHARLNHWRHDTPDWPQGRLYRWLRDQLPGGSSIDVFDDPYWTVAPERLTERAGGGRTDWAHLTRVRQQREADRVAAEQQADMALTNPADRPTMNHVAYPTTPATRWQRVRRWLVTHFPI